MYKVLINEIDVTNYCVSVPTNSNAKEKLELFLLPKYEFSFINIQDWITSFDNIYYKDIKLKLYNKLTNELLISGNIIEIIKNLNEVNIVIGTENDKFKELSKIGYWYNVNPVEIIKDICDYFQIPVDNSYYLKALKEYEELNIKISFFPDENSTLIDFINKLKEITDLDIYIANNKLIIDRLNGKDNISVFLTDKNVINASIATKPKYYTNFAIKTIDSNDVVLTDENSNNLFSVQRGIIGNVSIETIDVSSDNNIQIAVKDIAIYLQEKKLEYYSIEKRVFEIEIELRKYFTLDLSDIIHFQSSFFDFENDFEILEKQIDFINNKMKLTIKELNVSTAYSVINNGYGITPYGDNFGD